MQQMHVTLGESVRTVRMPAHNETVLPDVDWGRFDDLLSPAFWYGQIRQAEILGLEEHYRLGDTLVEEACACLLGGFGFSAEMGLAAFDALREQHMLQPGVSALEIEKLLKQPLVIDGRRRKYRFPKQKARYLAAAVERLSGDDFRALDDLSLRNLLIEVDGIGLKTASWIVRNHRGSDDVAIVDIHLVYACKAMGLISDVVLPRDYTMIEGRFLELCRSMKVSAAVMDSLIWRYVRVLKPVVERLSRSAAGGTNNGDSASLKSRVGSDGLEQINAAYAQ
jgi:thermostable 8-oxoguanine DNA glycosylase